MRPRAPSIRRLVRLARRRYGAARAAEAALLGTAAGGATLAAAVLSGAPLAAVDTWSLGLVSAALCAGTWLFERRRSAREMARRIDGGLASAGAFVTAFECEERAAGPLAAALVERVAADVGPREVRRTVSPPSIAFAAAPLLAVALVLFALEHGPDASLARARPALRALAAELGAAAGADEGRFEAGAPVAELAARAEQLAAEGPALDDVAAGLRGLREELDRLRTEPGVAAELERADELAAAALEALTGAPRSARSPERSAAGGGGARDDLAQAASRSTMEGSPSRDEDAPQASVAGSPGSGEADAAAAGSAEREAGVIAGRWWDERYDAIVAAWTESEGARRE